VAREVARRSEMTDPYMVFGPDPSHEEGSRYLTADQIGVGRLRKSDTIEGEWILSSVAPANYGTVSFEAEDHADAERKAIAWLTTQHADLLEELAGEDEDED
jgi:hypothetical protein